MGNTYTAKELLKLAKKQGFTVARQKGSHVQLCHPDGRRTTIPMHCGDIALGTAREILKDIGLKGGTK